MFNIDEKLLHLFSFLVAALGVTGKEEQHYTLTEELKKSITSGFEHKVFESGRYANVIQKNNTGNHALQVIRETTTSSFILTLNPDGTAAACRGWQYLSTNSGPEVNETEHIREQLGYRGVWSRDPKDGWIDIVLSSDDSLCARIGEYSHLIPVHAGQWHLRCFPYLFKGRPGMEEPILACQFAEMTEAFGEDHPHVVYDDVFGEHWLLLGAENGIRIKTESAGNKKNKPGNIHIEKSKDKIGEDAWQQSF